MISQGEVWWANLPPPTGSGPRFRRPVVVVQGDALNRSRIATVVCVPTHQQPEVGHRAGKCIADRTHRRSPEGFGRKRVPDCYAGQDSVDRAHRQASAREIGDGVFWDRRRARTLRDRQRDDEPSNPPLQRTGSPAEIVLDCRVVWAASPPLNGRHVRGHLGTLAVAPYERMAGWPDPC